MHSHARTSAKIDTTLFYVAVFFVLFLSPEIARRSSQINFNHGFETLSAPASLAATLRGFTFYVAVPISSIETLSAPASLAATLRGFTFYVAVPISSIETLSAPASLAATLRSFTFCVAAPSSSARGLHG